MIPAKWRPGGFLDLVIVIPSDETPPGSDCPVGAYGERSREESELSALFFSVVVGVFLDPIIVLSFCGAWRSLC